MIMQISNEHDCLFRMTCSVSNAIIIMTMSILKGISDYQSLSGNCVCISLQLNQPHALYLDSEHSQQERTCGECA